MCPILTNADATPDVATMVVFVVVVVDVATMAVVMVVVAVVATVVVATAVEEEKSQQL